VVGWASRSLKSGERRAGFDAGKKIKGRKRPIVSDLLAFLRGTQQTVLHGSAGGRSEPPLACVQAMRTDFGRPSSSMQLRTATATVISVARLYHDGLLGAGPALAKGNPKRAAEKARMPVMREAAGSESWIGRTSEIIKDRQVFLSGGTWRAVLALATYKST
jgi:hypothetical protein